MKRLIDEIVASGLVTACRFAVSPTKRSPFLLNATTDGVVRSPSWLATTWDCPACMTATTEFVVPRSIPMTFPISNPPNLSVLKGESRRISPAHKCAATECILSI